jgi:hypothetical protein
MIVWSSVLANAVKALETIVNLVRHKRESPSVVARHVNVELEVMANDVDRVQRAGAYLGFEALSTTTWERDGRVLSARAPDIFDLVAPAYVLATGVNREVRARRVQAGGLEIAVIPEDRLDELLEAIRRGREALEELTG